MNMNKHYRHDARDAAAHRVYQAFERLQFAWYSVNARRPAGNPQHLDEAALHELDAAEAEWLEARAALSMAALSR